MRILVVNYFDQLDAAEKKLRHLLVNFKILKAISSYSRSNYSQKKVIKVTKKKRNIVATVIKEFEDNGFLKRSIENRIQKIDFTDKLFKVIESVKNIS